jgi:hypothetical protein
MEESSMDALFAMAASAIKTDTSTLPDGPTECTHEITVEHDGEVFCSDCGEALRDLDTEFRKEKSKTVEDGGRCQSLQTGNIGILSDIQHIQSIPKKIKDQANHYFMEYMAQTKTNVLRQKSRRSIIAAVLYYAFLSENNSYPIERLANLLTITSREASQSLHKVARKIPRLRTIQITVQDVMYQILKKLGATDPLDFQWVEYIYSVIEHRNGKLNKARMNSVASGVVWYYIQREEKPIELDHFSRVCELSKTTIENIARIVEETYIANGGDE